MPLRNRVTPFGEIVADPARGAFTGNRGILHDPASRALHPTRRWTGKAWICCVCAFRGRRRDVMGYNGREGAAGWTELFFLDEATALSAGHRPCFYCRRADALRFQATWAQGNGGSAPKAAEMDALLHGERLDGRAKRMHGLQTPAWTLPDGTMVSDGESAWLVLSGQMKRWNFGGYDGGQPAPDAHLRLLTPPSTVAALGAGYVPVIDPSASA